MNLKNKLRALLKARSQGKEQYALADKLLDEVVGAMKPGEAVDIGGGRTATLVDQFADRAVVWKPAGVRRFEIKVTE